MKTEECNKFLKCWNEVMRARQDARRAGLEHFADGLQGALNILDSFHAYCFHEVAKNNARAAREEEKTKRKSKNKSRANTYVVTVEKLKK